MTTNRPEANDTAAYSEGAPMTDKTIPAGLTRDQARAVREWAERSYAAEVQDETMYHAARVLLAVLPKPHTLEDMTPETEDATPDAPAVGDVIESADDPRVSALPVGTVLQDLDGEEVTKVDESIDPWCGLGYVPLAGESTEFGPWTVLHIPKQNPEP